MLDRLAVDIADADNLGVEDLLIRVHHRVFFWSETDSKCFPLGPIF
jgi:hypothetical protein